MKASRISQQSGVDALGNLFGNLDSQRLAEVVDHLADRGGSRVDPVDVAERGGVGMMIDVDDKLILESRQTGSIDVAALDDERGIVTLSDVVLHDHKVRTGQNAVSGRHSVAQYHVR